MPKKKHQESQAEQSARFKRDAQELISAGKLDPAEADAAMVRMLRNAKAKASG